MTGTTTQPRPSAHVQAKADRLLAEGRVRHVDREPRGFTVDGDTGAYHVSVGRYSTWCTCPRARGIQPAGTECSHGLAAVRLFEREHGGSRL